MSSLPMPSWSDDSNDARPSFRPLKRFKLFLLRTPEKDLMFVVRTVMEVLRYGRAEATQRMWEAHHAGRSLLLEAHLERAELYADLFGGRGLRVELQPA